MVKINETLMRQIAHLARLKLSDSEIEVYTSQLGQVLEYAAQLEQLDVSGVVPLVHPFELNISLREDCVLPFLTDQDGRSVVLQTASEVVVDSFKVPPIL